MLPVRQRGSRPRGTLLAVMALLALGAGLGWLETSAGVCALQANATFASATAAYSGAGGLLVNVRAPPGAAITDIYLIVRPVDCVTMPHLSDLPLGPRRRAARVPAALAAKRRTINSCLFVGAQALTVHAAPRPIARRAPPSPRHTTERTPTASGTAARPAPQSRTSDWPSQTRG